MPARLALLLSNLGIKGYALFSAFLGFSLTESLTNQWGLAALSGVLAGAFGALGAWFVNRPRMVLARKDADASESGVRESETKALIGRMTDLHVAEVKFYQQRVSEKDLIITLERKSKHKAINEWTGALAMVAVLQSLLRDAGKTPPSFHPKTYFEIVGEEDRKIENIATARVVENGGLPRIET